MWIFILFAISKRQRLCKKTCSSLELLSFLSFCSRSVFSKKNSTGHNRVNYSIVDIGLNLLQFFLHFGKRRTLRRLNVPCLKRNKNSRKGGINDPLGQTHSHTCAGSDRPGGGGKKNVSFLLHTDQIFRQGVYPPPPCAHVCPQSLNSYRTTCVKTMITTGRGSVEWINSRVGASHQWSTWPTPKVDRQWLIVLHRLNLYLQT